MQDYFKTTSIHCQGQTSLDLDTLGNLYSVGNDDTILCINLATTNDKRSISCNPNNLESYTSLAAHPTEVGTLALGAMNRVEIMKKDSEEDGQGDKVYAPTGEVYGLAWGHGGGLLAIASDEVFPIVFNFASAKAIKCRPGHTGKVLAVVFSPDDKFLCSTSADGNLNIYKFDSQLDPQLLSFHKISLTIDPIGQQRLCSGFNPKGNIIAVPGKPQLQLLQYQQIAFKYTIQPRVKHDKDITICYWHSNQVLVTGGLDRTIILWNMVKIEKITFVPECSLSVMKRYNNRFYGINNTGSLHEFIRPELLIVKGLEIPQKIIEDEVMSVEEEPEKKQANQRSAPKPSPFRKQRRINQRLVTCVPQNCVTTACQMQEDQRFLLYNNIGCVVQRSTGQSQTVEVQYHDKSVLREKPILLQNRCIKAVVLWQSQFVYCTDNEFGYIGEVEWEYQVPEVLDVAMGTEWVASLTDQEIAVYDLAGTCLRKIEADRQYVAVRAYQDMLALVFHDLIPFQGNQCLRMRLFSINSAMMDFQETIVPLSRGSILKSFGISSRGLIYAQDSLGRIRVYLYDRREWVLIFDPTLESNLQNYWIIDIGANEFTAFIMPQSQIEPTVLPRMLPRQVKISVPVVAANPHNPNYGRILWGMYNLCHEKYRTREWFKYKYSRSKSNPYYPLSASILSDKQIEAEQQKIQSQLRNMVKKMVDAGEGKKAMHLAKSFLKPARVLEIFEQAAGCGPLAAALKTYYNEKAAEQSYLALKRIKLSFIDPNVVRNYGFTSLSFTDRTINQKLPVKQLLQGEQLQRRILSKFGQLQQETQQK